MPCGSAEAAYVEKQMIYRTPECHIISFLHQITSQVSFPLKEVTVPSISTNFLLTKRKPSSYQSVPFPTSQQKHFKMPCKVSYPPSAQLPSAPQYSDSVPPFDMNSYASSMHQHTKKQMEAATGSARRRTPDINGVNIHGSLDNGGGSVSSLDSQTSS